MNKSEKILYHYTSLEGLLGIIESKSIWATNVLYLNDASELNYALKLLSDEVNDIKGEIPLDANWLAKLSFFDNLILNIDEIILHPLNFGFFICSFSEEKDLLSQWRGYCPGGIGFSVGINLSKLKDCAKQKECSVTPCNYNEKDHKLALKKLINDILYKYDDEVKRAPLLKHGIHGEDKLLIDLFIKIIKLAPTFKTQNLKLKKNGE